MSKLTIFTDKDSERPLAEMTDWIAIKKNLATIQVRFERWQADRLLSVNPSADEVLAAYQSELSALMAEKNYQSFDVISMRTGNPGSEGLRQKFLSEHTHKEDEVRFFVAGRGLFCLHSAGKVYQLLCEKNDLISVPAGVAHWFDMGAEPNFTAIRIFDNPEGWIAHSTESTIASRYPLLT